MLFVCALRSLFLRKVRKFYTEYNYKRINLYIKKKKLKKLAWILSDPYLPQIFCGIFSVEFFRGWFQGHLWQFPEQLAKNVTLNDITIRFRISERIFVSVRIPDVSEVGTTKAPNGTFQFWIFRKFFNFVEIFLALLWIKNV